MICDRAPEALTCTAVQYTGTDDNLREITAVLGVGLADGGGGRHVLIDAERSVWTWLSRGDWIVRGVGSGWDFYVIDGAKFPRLWTPRG